MIIFDHVCKTYKQKNQTVKAVNNVSLKINTGEIFGIIGYSGAGKSTLLRLVNQLEQHDSGKIIIDDEDISKYSKKERIQLRRNVGMIFQHFNLMWSRTVYQNISLPLEIIKEDKNVIHKRVMELIKLVGLEGKEHSYPATLSGGQKQRVAIARALANNPSILLCDEATSALDPKTTDSIIKLLKDINASLNITIVLITHQMEVVEKLCHSTAIMVDGQVVETGKTSTIFKKPTHEATKHFIQTRDQINDEYNRIETMKKAYQNGTLLKLTFDESNTNESILYKVAIESKIPFSIVHASMTSTIDSTFGSMYIHTKESEYTKIVEVLHKLDVSVEVISC